MPNNRVVFAGILMAASASKPALPVPRSTHRQRFPLLANAVATHLFTMLLRALHNAEAVVNILQKYLPPSPLPSLTNRHRQLSTKYTYPLTRI